METKLLNKLKTIQNLAETSNSVIYDEAIQAISILEEIMEANQFALDFIKNIRKAERDAIIKYHFELTKN